MFNVTPWPTQFIPTLRPVAMLTGLPARRPADWLAERHAARLADREQAIRCGGQTAGYTELLYTNISDFTAFNTSASEGSLLTNSSTGDQPYFGPNYFTQRERRAIIVEAMGVISNTGTPTIIFQARIGSTIGAATLTGTSVGVSAAITTASGITNKLWRLRLLLTCRTSGQGSNKCTLSGAGTVWSGDAFASPFEYPLEPSTPDTATWTSTIDASVTNYLNLSVTWSASSASNTITCKHLNVYGLN